MLAAIVPMSFWIALVETSFALRDSSSAKKRSGLCWLMEQVVRERSGGEVDGHKARLASRDRDTYFYHISRSRCTAATVQGYDQAVADGAFPSLKTLYIRQVCLSSSLRAPALTVLQLLLTKQLD